MVNDNNHGKHQDQEQNDLIKRSQKGECEAFVTLLVDHGYRKVIYAVIQELTSQTSPQKTWEALYRKLVKDVYRTLPEFRHDDEDFGDWLHRTAKASLIAERKRIIRAKKGDKEAFYELIEEYKEVIHKVVQEYAPKLQEYEEKTLFDVIVNEASWAVRGFQFHQNAFELWLHDTATENCCFIHSKEQFENGNQEAFGEVFSQYYAHFIPQVIQKNFPKMQDQDKKEVLQDVTLRAYEKIPQFRGNINAFKKWLRRTIRGVCLNMLNIQEKKEEYNETKGVHGNQDNPSQVRDELNFAQKAIELLPEIYKDVVILCNWEGLKYKEIAEILDTPIGNVKRRLYEARSMLREVRHLVEDCNVSLQDIKTRLCERRERDKKAKLPKILDELNNECSSTR